MSTILNSLTRTVSVNELQGKVSQFNIGFGLYAAIVLSSKLLRGQLDQLSARVNSFNMPLFAKAFLLWGDLSGGRRLAEEDIDELLTSINSLPWYSRLAAEFDTNDAVLGMMFRQGFQRYYTDDPLDARIARTWMMFNELVKEGGLDVPDPSTELEQLTGVSVEDLWVVGFMFWSYHVGTTALDPSKCVFNPRAFVLEGNRRDEIGKLVDRVVQRISLTPSEFRERYHAEQSKYRDSTNREGYWLSEFNILRDYPLVNLGNSCYAAPFPTYGLTRAIDGFYFDLLEEFARRKRASGATDNAYDNEMNRTLGTLMERYVGRQLRLLQAPGLELRGEFSYRHRRSDKLSTDWILLRNGRRPVLFECKAREAILEFQRYGSLEQLRTEVSKAIGKACRQLVRFIQAVDENARGLEQYHGQREFVCAVILQAPLPFHMVRDIREVIESVAAEMEPGWTRIRSRIHFVPMSVRELETAVATELKNGVAIEDQLVEYAEYREQVRRLERIENGQPVFPMHFEDFVQERHNGRNRVVNPLCAEKWKEFLAFCQQRIFGEDISVVEQEIFEITQKRAYELWEKRCRPMWDDQRDWLEAEQQLTDDPQFACE